MWDLRCAHSSATQNHDTHHTHLCASKRGCTEGFRRVLDGSRYDGQTGSGLGPTVLPTTAWKYRNAWQIIQKTTYFLHYGRIGSEITGQRSPATHPSVLAHHVMIIAAHAHDNAMTMQYNTLEGGDSVTTSSASCRRHVAKAKLVASDSTPPNTKGRRENLESSSQGWQVIEEHTKRANI